MGTVPQGLEMVRNYRALADGEAARARGPEKPKWGTTILFLAPAGVLLLVFLIYPAIYTVFLSFNRGRNGVFGEWVRLDNYARLFADPGFVNFALIAVGIWGSVGFATVILSAAVKSIPAEVIESARVEGANERQIFFRMILPMVSLPVSVLAVTLVVNVIKLFDLIFVMTGGGPGTASQVIAFTMYQQAFGAGQWGYGAAVAVVMLILLTPIMIFNVRRFRAGSVT